MIEKKTKEDKKGNFYGFGKMFLVNIMIKSLFKLFIYIFHTCITFVIFTNICISKISY